MSQTAGHYMLRALAHAHTQIMNTCARDAQASGKTMKCVPASPKCKGPHRLTPINRLPRHRVTDGGTTTLLGGILLELEEVRAHTPFR